MDPKRTLLIGLLAGASSGGLAGYVVGHRERIKASMLRALERGVSKASQSASALAKQLPEPDNSSILDVKGTLSATGPGLMVGKSRFSRIHGTADLGGVGMAATFTNKEVGSLLSAVGAKRLARKARTQLPPGMYVGMELSPLPFTAGAVVDRSTLEQTKARLQNLEDAIASQRRQAQADVPGR